VDKVFEQGRVLRKRKSDFLRRLNACPKDDQSCRRHVIVEQIKAERLTARDGPGRKHGAIKRFTDEMVSDSMGRPMQLLFSAPVTPDAAALKSDALSVRPSMLVASAITAVTTVGVTLVVAVA